jgi:lysyl-tRNA synthetase class 2
LPFFWGLPLGRFAATNPAAPHRHRAPPSPRRHEPSLHLRRPGRPEQDENKLVAERRDKLKALRAAQAAGGAVAFPNDFKPKDRAAGLHQAHGATEKEAFEADLAAGAKIAVSVAGRMMLKRVMGKASFATLQDATGRIQIYVVRRRGRRRLRRLQALGPGRHRGRRGHLFKTKTGELSIHATSVRLLTKSLRPLPDKFHGMPTRS